MVLRKLVLIAATGMWFALLGLAAAVASNAGEKATSQSLLFDAPYLERLALPQTLSYSYRRKTENEKKFGSPINDAISVKISKSKKAGGLNKVSLEIFTGAKQRRLGPHTDMRGNPVLMAFLELDVWHMKRRVGGVPVYFRNSIRKAFRESAAVEEIKIEFEGRMVPAHKVTIKPFVKDPNAPRLKEFRKKVYEFTVSDMVPGGFHKIRSWVPKLEGTGLLIDDTLIFTGTDDTGADRKAQ
jgi:hypothetical protein